jgi:hypothetical protein
MLATVAIMAIFAFVFLDPVMKYLGQGPQMENPVVVETRYGDWNQAQLDGLRFQRELVNRFLQQVTYQTILARNKAGQVQPHQLEMQAQQLFLFWHQMLMQRTKPGPEESAIETLVLSRKAQEMGMVVSDQTVNDLIAQITENSLTTEALKQIIASLTGDRMSGGVKGLFDALRTELLASKLSQFFFQSARDVTPAQRFSYYEALNRRAKAEVMPLPVSSFLAQVTAVPTAAEAQKLYDAHKESFPDPSSPEPGFKEPKRASFQYFKADYARFIEEAKPSVTDAEIAEYYEKNKIQFRAVELPKDEPAEGAPKSEAAPSDAPADPAGAAPPAEKSPDAPADGKPAEDAPGADKPAAEPPANETPTEEKATEEKPTEEPQASPPQAARRVDRFRLVSQETTAAEPPAEPKPVEPKPSEPKPAEASASESKPVAEPAGEKPAEEQKPASDTQPPEEKPTEEKPAEGGSPAEEVKYEPLEKVRDTIRESLASNKAIEKISKSFEELQGIMRRYEDDRAIYESRKEKTGKPPVFDLEGLAKKYGFEGKTLEMVTAAEAAETDLGGVSRITGASSFDIRRQPFAEFAFADSLVTYRPEAGQDDEGNGYLYWKTDEKAAYVPTLDQIRDQVVLAWKTIQARELARKRAEELALQARTAKKPLQEVFAGQADLAVTETDWFSWLTTGSVPQNPLGMQPRISEIGGVSYPDDDFMKKVFALEAGEVAVASNHPQAIFYVVRLAEYERPMDELRSDFAAEPPNRYMMVADRDRRKLYLDWLADINQQADVQWLRPADAEVRRVASNPSQSPLDEEF